FFITEPSHATEEAIQEVVDANADVDRTWKQFSDAPSHFDGEEFVAGGTRLHGLFQDILRLLAQNKTKEARTKLGGALHTVQDFYSHSNWVELHGMVPSDATHFPFPTAPGLAGPKDTTCETCIECSEDVNTCENNLKSGLLTSGYFELYGTSWHH